MKRSMLFQVIIITSMVDIAAATDINWPAAEWTRAKPADVGMDGALLRQARDYALKGGGSGRITRHGRLVMEWGDQAKRYDLKSTTKSIGVTALGLALLDGKVKSLDDLARDYHPSFGTPPESNAKRRWRDKITLFHLATQTAGFDKPGGYTELMFEPGTKWSYSDGGPNWLAECLTLSYKRDVRDLMFERVFDKIGVTADDLTWRRNSYREKELNGVARREFGSGVSANADAMARIGYLYLRRGEWRGERIIPASFVDAARMTPKSVRGKPVVKPETYFDASNHYGLLWWNNGDLSIADAPRDAYWSWGLYDSLIVVIPSLDIVASRAGKSLRKQRGSDYNVLAPFIGAIAQSVHEQRKEADLPYPPSEAIVELKWDAPSTIVRRAKGSDNWPMTWADDDRLYTAYGDGWGFEPRTEKKLSLGFARVTGGPDDFIAENVRSATGETLGGGPKGKKASGLLSIDGMLYAWVRNAKNSQLAWSRDHARTWMWSDWRFETSFGCPTFLNFGRDYAGARDEYVYVYSLDGDSAYEPSDRMVLARAPRDRVKSREAYEFLKRLDTKGRPVWAREIERRGAVFERKGRCYRSGVSYCAGLKRYLWVQVVPAKLMNTRGSLAIYDAPEPWGPWTTVYQSDDWDVDPGETACLPTKWMSDDGRRLHLVFSGDDSFSVRAATVVLPDGK